MCVQESGSPQSGHASVGAGLYLKASLPLYSWPYMNLTIVMPSLWECYSNCVCSGALGFGVDDEASVEGGVVKVSNGLLIGL